MKNESVGECLDTCGLPDGEVADPPIWKAHHVFTTGHTMIPGLQCFGGFIKWTSSVAGIRSRPCLEEMIHYESSRLPLWIGQIGDCVPNRLPGCIQRQQRTDSFQPGPKVGWQLRPVPFADFVTIPILARHPLIHRQRICRMRWGREGPLNAKV